MAISFILALTSNNFFIENPYKSQAIELFGNDLAHSLHNKAHSWKKLMQSWNAFFKACSVIKNSQECFGTIPKRIYCSLQSRKGLIFQTNRYTRHDLFDAEGILITPFGYFDVNFRTTEAMYQFIRNLQEEFYTKSLEDSHRNKKYSFSLTPNQEVSLKSLFNFFRGQRATEIPDDTFTLSHILEIINIIKHQLHVVIEESSIYTNNSNYMDTL